MQQKTANSPKQTKKFKTMRKKSSRTSNTPNLSELHFNRFLPKFLWRTHHLHYVVRLHDVHRHPVCGKLVEPLYVLHLVLYLYDCPVSESVFVTKFLISQFRFVRSLKLFFFANQQKDL